MAFTEENSKKNQLVFKKVATVPEAHGWGIERVGSDLVVSGNFSNRLYFFDPLKSRWGRTLTADVSELEDLAWDGKRLWSSSFSSHPGTIFSINIQTGKVQDFWELPEKSQCPVIDGIAVQEKSLWITGKECPAIYQVKIPQPRAISSQSPKK